MLRDEIAKVYHRPGGHGPRANRRSLKASFKTAKGAIFVSISYYVTDADSN